MLKRTLVFSNAMDLSLKFNQIVIAYRELPTETVTVPIEDVGVVVLENQMTKITLPLLNALADANVSVVFCNNKGMPNSMLFNMESNNTQGETLRLQIAAGEVMKKQMWKQIVEAKIRNQSLLLDKVHGNGGILKPYYSNVKSGDTDNREGIAARLYWQRLFGDDFIRDRTLPGINALLNYGYTILRAATARSLVGSGLLPAIGIFHHNRSNAFPLADDMMEPYRPYVDEIVYGLMLQDKLEVNRETKAELINVLYADTCFSKVMRPLQVGLTMTSASIVRCYAKESMSLCLPLFQ